MKSLKNATQEDYRDLELLKQAAKAIGLNVIGPYMPNDDIGGLNIVPSGERWNPLESDADAQRLVYDLDIQINIGECATMADVRRAIVRAAAAIGSAM